MNWSLFVVVVILNTFLCVSQFIIEQIDRKRGAIKPRHSVISGTRKKFLYWEDFYAQTYGDFFGLVFVMNGFAHLFINGISSWEWLVFIVVSIASVAVFVYMNLQDSHKPDWGYPAKGKISLGGIIHLPYFGALSGMSVICLINIINGGIEGILLYTTISGMAIYLITVVLDIKSGHFDSLKKMDKILSIKTQL